MCWRPMIEIRNIELPAAGFEELHAEARAEGFDFMDTLLDDWLDGSNRFDAPGEALCGVFEQERLIAVGGLNVDPFLNDPEVGRVRRVYVRAAWRNKGIGAALVMALVERAKASFRHVRLRAESADAGRLYERLGFAALESADATHGMEL